MQISNARNRYNVRDPFYLRIVRSVFKVMHAAAFIALMAMMAVVVANIIGRIFFKAPIMGTLEIAGFSGVVFVAVAVGFAQRERRNVYVDVVVKRFPPRVRLIVDGFTHLLGLIGVGFLLWAVTESAVEAMIDGEITLMLSVKTYPFRFIWAVGLLVLCGFLLQHFIKFLKEYLKG
jgi:TRAP-type C4-dicarboxylate transport system permease small subunit